MKARIRGLVLGLAMFHAGFATTPGNLVPNGDFATSTEGWTCSGPCAFSFSSASNDGTGSIAFPSTTSGTITSSCFAISPNLVYTLGFSAYDEVGPVDDTFQMFCSMFSDATCTTGVSDFVVAENQVFYIGMGSPNWQSSGPMTFTTPADARSASCQIGYGGNGGNQAFDDVFFLPPDPIFANGFE